MKHANLASGIASGVLLLAVWLLPSSTLAFSAELDSISPEPTQDISDMIGDAPENITLFGWLTEVDTEYTAVFSVDEEPALVITIGGDMTADENWEYDADAGTVTVTFTATGIIAANDETGELGEDPVSVIALVPAVEIGEDGPPEEMTGSWFATNIDDWELIPPSEENIAFGYQLTGPQGSTGYFRMFMPESMRELLSQFAGEELSWDDLAVFSGDEQSSISITEVDGGALVNINVTFTSTSAGASIASAGTVTKRITVSEQEHVSISATKSSLKKGKKVRIFGWLKNGKKNQTVTIWRKRKGESEFTKWKTLTTEDDGYYALRFAPKKTATYKVQYTKNGKTKKSDTKKISVE